MGCDLIVYPELAADDVLSALGAHRPGRRSIPSTSARCRGAETRPLFTLEAEKLKIGFSPRLCRADRGERPAPALQHLHPRRQEAAASSAQYRKIHLPGSADAIEGRQGQHLEKHYFEVGDLGFGVFRAFGGIMGMCICNDRRWPETYRVMGLQGVEMIMLGYNSPVGLGDSLRPRFARAVPQPPGHAVRRLSERAPGSSAPPSAASRRAIT